ncbi:hypothetical protein MRB53_041941 [Persea americana]|nr:hypothetical protein MRB53_041941 [Persea americana]
MSVTSTFDQIKSRTEQDEKLCELILQAFDLVDLDMIRRIPDSVSKRIEAGIKACGWYTSVQLTTWWLLQRLHRIATCGTVGLKERIWNAINMRDIAL